jgi:hypothetical protein
VVSWDVTASGSMRCICEYAVCAESGLRRMMLRVCEGCLGLVVLTQQQKRAGHLTRSEEGHDRSSDQSLTNMNTTCLMPDHNTIGSHVERPRSSGS